MLPGHPGALIQAPVLPGSVDSFRQLAFEIMLFLEWWPFPPTPFLHGSAQAFTTTLWGGFYCAEKIFTYFEAPLLLHMRKWGRKKLRNLLKFTQLSECWNKKLDSGRWVPASCSPSHVLQPKSSKSKKTKQTINNRFIHSLSFPEDNSSQKLAKQNIVNFMAHWWLCLSSWTQALWCLSLITDHVMSLLGAFAIVTTCCMQCSSWLILNCIFIFQITVRMYGVVKWMCP